MVGLSPQDRMEMKIDVRKDMCHDRYDTNAIIHASIFNALRVMLTACFELCLIMRASIL
jgi:hypothetical protein